MARGAVTARSRIETTRLTSVLLRPNKVKSHQVPSRRLVSAPSKLLSPLYSMNGVLVIVVVVVIVDRPCLLGSASALTLMAMSFPYSRCLDTDTPRHVALCCAVPVSQRNYCRAFQSPPRVTPG
jgi:hypothetical protein